MESFLRLVEILAGAGVVIAAASSYLRINKLWTRRAKQDVAESISISAALLGMATGFPFLLQFVLVDQNWAAAARSSIGILTGVVFTLVGMGMWVPELRGRGFFSLFGRALNLERKESGDLVKALVQPKGARELMDVFEAMAHVDRHVDAREIALIGQFAERWRVEAPDLMPGASDHAGDFLTLRAAVDRYLAIRPPAEQAAELMDVLSLFVHADDVVSPEEELVLEEISGMVTGYVAQDGEAGTHEVVIVPQSDEQKEAVTTILPGITPCTMRGGTVYSVGRYFSAKYAEAVCERYIALGLFTTRVEA